MAPGDPPTSEGAFKATAASTPRSYGSVLIASAHDAVRFVLADCALRKGLHAFVVSEASGVWASLHGSHSIRAMLFTPDHVGAAATAAAYELAREGWFVALVPFSPGNAMLLQGSDDRLCRSLTRIPLLEAVDSLLDATRDGHLGPITRAGPRLSRRSSKPPLADPDVNQEAHAPRPERAPTLQHGPLRLDVLNDRVYVNGALNEDIRGSLFHVLKILMRRPGEKVMWSEIDPAVFGVRKRSREARRKTLQRLRVALKEHRLLLAGDSSCLQIRSN
jgi:hypothetical protein